MKDIKENLDEDYLANKLEEEILEAEKTEESEEVEESSETEDSEESEELEASTYEKKAEIIHNHVPIAIKSTTEEDYSKEGKSIVIMVLGIILVFGLIFGGFSLYNHLMTPEIITIDDLVEQNLNGELPEEEGYIYNNHSFVYVDGLWWTDVFTGERQLRIPLHFGPKELENVTVTGKISNDFDKGDTIYVAVNPTVADKYYTLALMEMNNNIIQGINRNITGVCTEPDEICEEREILNCKDAKGLPVIQLSLGGEAGIQFKDTCILITGSEVDIVRSVDRLLYKWYGVME